jgi:hypothetical protein
MFHYPIEEWDGRYHGSIHLHGHSHGKARKMKNRFFPFKNNLILWD